MPGVYISYPFCSQKCSFCNFASGTATRDVQDRYLAALKTEITAHQWSWIPETVYLGGGTPSQVEPESLALILALLPGRSSWAEATIEAAPGTITLDKAEGWVDAGINRVSLGVQSFVEKELVQTGRRHNAETVIRDCQTLRRAGLTNINIDLIAGLPFQTPKGWEASLKFVQQIAPPHVSVYIFEVDEDSRLGLEILQNGRRYGSQDIPGDELVVELYDRAVLRLKQLGIERYEISNFSRPGRESRHNLKYWTLDPYVGFGADAHSFDGVHRSNNPEEAVAYAEGGWQKFTVPAKVAEERLFMGLRLMSGIELDAREWETYGGAMARFAEAGLLVRQGARVRLTDRGVVLSNEVFEAFLA